jgi:hypothetical protein
MHHGLLTKTNLLTTLLGWAPLEVVENLQSIEDEGEKYMNQWKKYGQIIPQDYLWNEDE